MKVKYEPAVYLYAANAAVALAVAYGLPLTQFQTVGIALAATTAFGLNLTSDQIGTTVAALSIVLALALRANVSPVVKAVPLSNDRTERPFRP